MLFAMMFGIAAVVFVIGYFTYGRFMGRVYGLNNDNVTPAIRFEDGIDFVPAHPAVLLGHHFASIAGAGPVTGPIAAAMLFGWLPTVIWVIVGSTFLGGPHDLGAIVSSIRHDGNSIGTVTERWIGKAGKYLFLGFTILTIFLIVAVFLVMSSGTFAGDPVVAFVSTLFIILAFISGNLIYKFHVPLFLVTLVMLAIILGACVYVNETTCPWLIGTMFKHDTNFWNAFLAIYCFVASVLPVWMLLQPRDYLASYFLYFAVAVGAYGMLTGSALDTGTIPAITANVQYFGFSSKAMWPMMFIMVACGAISGFHGLIGSGTTSRQIRQEKDALLIGYGAMLVEGIVAIISVGTLMVLGADAAKTLSPVQIFSQGFGKFSSLLGFDPVFGARLGAIAINSFLLTSLDTAARLGRYQIQEISGGKIGMYPATIGLMIVSLLLVYSKTTDASGHVIATWAAIWPLFGSANQMVASLSLLAIAAWIKMGLKKNHSFMYIPYWFIMITTLFSLVIQLKEHLAVAQPNYLLSILAALLIILGVAMSVAGVKAMHGSEKA